MSTVLTVGEVEADSWVDAAPFRTYLRHLMALGEVSPGCVALLAGIRPRLALHLLHGRRGRPLRRISAESARLLLDVTPDVVLAVRSRQVPARTTARHLGQLQDEGWSRPELAELLGVTSAQVTGLASGAARSCSQLVALRAAAEVALTHSPSLPGVALKQAA